MRSRLHRSLACVAVLAIGLTATVVLAGQGAKICPLDLHPDGEFMYAYEEAFSAMGIKGNYPIDRPNDKTVVDISRGPDPTIPPIGIEPIKTQTKIAAAPAKPGTGALIITGGSGSALTGRSALVSALEKVRQQLQ